ncbi:MAG: GNAT family N-acetyltransferase, partial [Ignavibacteriales bacterium]|nr:GNAT family N-acetyltransferase [Ignavibacteriales bacterium]
MLNFVQAASQEQISTARELFLEYADSLKIDLCFQGFDKELKELPGEYAPPHGRLFLFYYDNQLAGCAALRKQDDGIGEMKRLYLKPAFRGKGIGRAIATHIIAEARSIGYAHLRLDTLPMMKEAIPLYRSLGFQEIKPYRVNPIVGALYMELQ